MANTYTKLHFHYIFSPHLRQHLIRPEIKDTLKKYMTDIVQNKGQKVLAIHCAGWVAGNRASGHPRGASQSRTGPTSEERRQLP